MASIRREISVGVSSEEAWAAIRDFGAVHRRVAPGFLTAVRTDGNDRIVTFAMGAVVTERLVGADDDHRRLVYTVVDGPLGASHHQASVEVVDTEGEAPARVIWITDVLPDEVAPIIDRMMDEGAAAMAATMAG